MKRIITLAICLSFLPSLQAQKLEYDTDSKWFLGLNTGGTWNTTDVRNKTHIGWGFTLGRSFNYNYGKKFSFDLRLRYLGGKWYGQDYDTTSLNGYNPSYSPGGSVVQTYDTLGYTVNNFQAEVHELGLELVLHANGLRERTGWDPYIFGGVNIVWNQTYGDLYNQDTLFFNNSFYNYSPDGMSKPEWKEMSDGIYDTALDGSHQTDYNVNFMPSLGIGLAYQVGPRFSLGIEHKTTFALKDVFDGYEDNTLRWGMFENDIYHYTALMLKFNFRSRATVEHKEPEVVDCLKPAIDVQQPRGKRINTSSPVYEYAAVVSQVATASNLQLSINGELSNNFTYDATSSKVNSSFALVLGENRVKLTASNECGTVSETVVIFYEECVPPTVVITMPNTPKTVVEQPAYTVFAQLTHPGDIIYSINDRPLNNYNYNEETNTFSSTITLTEGINRIKIQTSNECGTAEQTVEVEYVKCDAPKISTTYPGNVVTAENKTFDLVAQFENIIAKNQITLKLNGVVQVFTYTTATKKLTKRLTLSEGVNVVEIIAKNECSEVVEIINIDYNPCVTPKITMIAPQTSEVSTQTPVYTVQATIDNINFPSQVQVKVNGQTVTNGFYNMVTDVFTKDISLSPGSNNVTLTVTSDCGTVNTSFVVNYTVPQIDNNITICFKGQQMVIKESQWAAYQSQGATQGECPPVVDNNMTICFKGQQMVIKESQWAAYQSQGATQGECPPVVDNNITICFKGQQMVIKESQWLSYQRQGAVKGDCPEVVDKEIVICLKGSTLTIKESQWLSYQRLGAVKGKCPEVVDEDLVICLNNKTITIKESQWIVYQKQGASKGKCRTPVVDVNITICLNGETLVIKESQWATYQSQGAVTGECPEQEVEQMITICHTNPNDPTDKQTIEIPISEWPAHQAHGDTQGQCAEAAVVGNDEKVICHNGVTKIIKKIEWIQYKMQGATEGACN